MREGLGRLRNICFLRIWIGMIDVIKFYLSYLVWVLRGGEGFMDDAG